MAEPFVSKYTAPEIEALLDMVHDGKGGSGFTVGYPNINATKYDSDYLLKEKDGTEVLVPENEKFYLVSDGIQSKILQYNGTTYDVLMGNLSSWITNKKILDKFTEDSDGNLLYNGKQVFLSKPESTTENTSNN